MDNSNFFESMFNPECLEILDITMDKYYSYSFLTYSNAFLQQMAEKFTTLIKLKSITLNLQYGRHNLRSTIREFGGIHTDEELKYILIAIIQLKFLEEITLNLGHNLVITDEIFENLKMLAV